MTLSVTETIETEAKVQYLCTLVPGEALRHFDLLPADVENTDPPLDVDYLLKCLAWYFPPVNSLSKQKRAIHICMKKPYRLKVRRYTERLIDLDEYLAFFPGAIMTDKIGVTELNEILLNSMPNIWYNQAYVQGFDYEYISFKNSINMFERMEIS